jgi:hypothetical protein
LAPRYWERILQTNTGELVYRYYECQIKNLQCGNWAKRKLREELDKIGFRCNVCGKFDRRMV